MPRVRSGFQDRVIIVGIIESRNPGSCLVTSSRLWRNANHVLSPGRWAEARQRDEILVILHRDLEELSWSARVRVPIENGSLRILHESTVTISIEQHSAAFGVSLQQHFIDLHGLGMKGDATIDIDSGPAQLSLLNSRR